MKIEKSDNNTYLLGTIKEVCHAIGSIIQKDWDNGNEFAFPEFYFVTVDRHINTESPLRDIARGLGGWYGCKTIVNDFESSDIVTILADYAGGGAAVAGSLWLDELYAEIVGDVISTVMCKSIEMQEPINKDSVVIIETSSPFPLYSDEELARLHNKYEKFKLQWMVDHGYTLEALVASLASELEDTEEPLRETYEIWEKNFGFDGEIWPCFDEWLENENKN